jgi:Ca-activated chloride channel family protein
VTFATPLALWALVLVPIAAAAYVWLQRRRVRDASAFVSPALFPNVVDRVPGWRRHLPIALLLLAVATMLVGFARPHATISERSEEATVVLAIDTSRSMGAKDVAPTRLAAAQASARAFLAHVPKKYRVAVVAFSSQPQVVSAPTVDRAFVKSAINDLRIGQGTALGDGLANAIQVATGHPAGKKLPAGTKPVPAAILVISDGAQDGGRVQIPEAVKRARAARIPIFTALLGTPDGIVNIPLVGGYNEQVHVPTNPGAMRTVAQQTGGKFYTAPTQADLSSVYRDLKSRLGKKDTDEEITVAFAAAGAVLLLAGCMLSALWFRRIP